ncbi:hypothetical protein OE88DRAFT_948891 [Heliocybe sulcata]|uniref:Uncharacterized protein n=1 Tax=Heliocybe sulcata TaxID=5364 RepID=A0A5C3NCI7_9AGAM|nr:hypothetical protein OE88DRAFT_948891 [Heliocybe sulcata]
MPRTSAYPRRPEFDNLAHPVLTVDHMHPPFFFSGMVEVESGLTPGFDLEDRVIEGSALAWPVLRVLQLGIRAHKRLPPPKASADSLVCLACHYPDLEALNLTVDAQTDVHDL